MKVVRMLPALVLGTVLLAPEASAQPPLFKSWYACGGNSSTFDTCASVALTIDGTNVSVAVKNLSGTSYDTGSGPVETWNNTVFTAIGFEWAGPAQLVADGSTVTSMTGVTVQNKDSEDPSAWVIKNEKQVGGGIKLDLVGTTEKGLDDGIISDLSDFSNPTSNEKNFWLSGNSSGWVTFSFDVLPNSLTSLDDVGLLIKGQNGPDGPDDSLQLICGVPGSPTADICDTTVVPEPLSIALLATGLFGLGFVRRRRNRSRKEQDLGI